MLKSISIKNYILIEDISIEFENCFSVLTGETGAGKSILIGALSLILGKRADVSVLLNKQKKCVIEAQFDISNTKTNEFFKTNDVDYDHITIVRREINPAGKSRAFINDTPVNLSTIKSFTGKLIDLHSQHENLAIADYKYRLGVIDSYAQTLKLYDDYKNEFNKYSELKSLEEKYKNELQTANKEIDYYKFQVEQIEALNINNDNELHALESESQTLENAEEIKTELSKSAFLLSEDENSVESVLKSVKSSILTVARSYKNADSIINRLESVLIELRDIAEEIRHDESVIEINPTLLEKTNQRIDAINSVLTKHNCKDINELISIFNKYKSKINSTVELENKLAEYKGLVDNQKEKIINIALELNRKRESSFKTIEKSVISTLCELGMPNSSFVISNNKSSEPTVFGYDNVEFNFSANRNMQVKPLEKVASGGELSRLMLTIKSMLAKGMDLPTIIFDEIDTGVSGEIADKMADIMNKIASERQVVSITHLPQVAAKGKHHYKVYKDETGKKTKTFVKKLNPNDRLVEIASMISGAKTTPQAIENAKILLNVSCS